MIVSSSNQTDAHVEMLDLEHDLTRLGHPRNLSSFGTGEEEPVSYFVYKAFELVYKSYYNKFCDSSLPICR